MGMSDEFKSLQFPCECVSGGPGGYSDPWAEITKKKLLPNGTKEEILNLVAREPKTISQLAEALDLSPPSVHTHINDMMKSELLRESEEWEKKYPTERYYEPNFPVFKAEECAEFKTLCQEMAKQVAALFEKNRPGIERAFGKTGLANQGWELSDITQCLYANMQRGARALLEKRGMLSSREKHANGAAWIFWAEEAENLQKKKNFFKKGKILIATSPEKKAFINSSSDKLTLIQQRRLDGETYNGADEKGDETPGTRGPTPCSCDSQLLIFFPFIPCSTSQPPAGESCAPQSVDNIGTGSHQAP